MSLAADMVQNQAYCYRLTFFFEGYTQDGGTLALLIGKVYSG